MSGWGCGVECEEEGGVEWRVARQNSWNKFCEEEAWQPIRECGEGGRTHTPYNMSTIVPAPPALLHSLSQSNLPWQLNPSLKPLDLYPVNNASYINDASDMDSVLSLWPAMQKPAKYGRQSSSLEGSGSDLLGIPPFSATQMSLQRQIVGSDKRRVKTGSIT